MCQETRRGPIDEKLLRDNVRVKGRILAPPSLHVSRMFAGEKPLWATITLNVVENKESDNRNGQVRRDRTASISAEITHTQRSEKTEISLCKSVFSQKRFVTCPTLISLTGSVSIISTEWSTSLGALEFFTQTRAITLFHIPCLLKCAHLTMSHAKEAKEVVRSWLSSRVAKRRGRSMLQVFLQLLQHLCEHGVRSWVCLADDEKRSLESSKVLRRQRSFLTLCRIFYSTPLCFSSHLR